MPEQGPVHLQTEALPWRVETGAPAREHASSAFIASAKRTRALAAAEPEHLYGPGPWAVHRGGGLWLKDAQGWFQVRNLAGVDWAGQFCADPARVDRLRQIARRVYAGFPEAARELAIRPVLDTPIVDAAGVRRFTDSILNASLALPPRLHDGRLPEGSGVEHYPEPIVHMAITKRDDFELFVTDFVSGTTVAVTPAGPLPGGPVQLVWAAPGTELGLRAAAAASRGAVLVFGATHPLAQQAWSSPNTLVLADDVQPVEVISRAMPAELLGVAQQGGSRWTIRIPDHPRRTNSAWFFEARSKARELATADPAWFYGPPPWQVHHGGSLWLKDDVGWFAVRNLVGIEWSAQFSADPAKVDLLRRNARRLYAAFPAAVEALGIRGLLDEPITDAAGVARWTDSICNASTPLPPSLHGAVLPMGAGIHHYPAPVAEIQLYMRRHWRLWVTDPATGRRAAVLPRGDAEGGVAVRWAEPGTALGQAADEARRRGRWLVAPPGSGLVPSRTRSGGGRRGGWRRGRPGDRRGLG